MGIRYYDEAVVRKISRIVVNNNLVILAPNETSRLFQIQADINNDKELTLPLIAISRNADVQLDWTGKNSMSFDGVHLDGSKMLSIQLNAIPMQISYQLDIYTQKFEEGDEYVRQLLFTLINNPKMTVTLPYNNANIEHNCYIKISNTVTDNSDISERLFPGEFTRWTISFSLDDAYFFDIPVKENGRLVSVDLATYGKTEENKDIIEVEAVELPKTS